MDERSRPSVGPQLCESSQKGTEKAQWLVRIGGASSGFTGLSKTLHRHGSNMPDFSQARARLPQCTRCRCSSFQNVEPIQNQRPNQPCCSCPYLEQGYRIPHLVNIRCSPYVYGLSALVRPARTRSGRAQVEEKAALELRVASRKPQMRRDRAPCASRYPARDNFGSSAPFVPLHPRVTSC